MTGRLRLRWAVLAAAVGLQGCAAAVVGGAAPGGYDAGPDARPEGQAESDAAITSRVEALLARDSQVEARRITVDTSGGVVTLKGRVGSPHARRRAIELARGVTGVRDVVSELRVIRDYY